MTAATALIFAEDQNERTLLIEIQMKIGGLDLWIVDANIKVHSDAFEGMMIAALQTLHTFDLDHMVMHVC